MDKLDYCYKNLPILVTGGAGFIGSYLCEELVKLGATVTILDNLSTGNLDNIATIKDKINFINGDITDLQTCINTTKDQKIIFHLAAFISVPDSMDNPFKCNQTNVQGTFNLLEAARINKVEKFIFSSSSAVYGKKEEICNESDICEPISIYGLTKLIGEQYCKFYNNFFGIKTVSLRYFNVFGDRQNPNGAYAGVVAKFTKCLKNNEPITIYGDGSQKRDYVSVCQVVRANIVLGQLIGQEINEQVINVASGTSITLIELLNKLKTNFPDYNNEIKFMPARIGDIKISVADCKKLKDLFQFY